MAGDHEAKPEKKEVIEEEFEPTVILSDDISSDDDDGDSSQTESLLKTGDGDDDFAGTEEVPVIITDEHDVLDESEIAEVDHVESGEYDYDAEQMEGITEPMGESQELGAVTEPMGESQELGGVTESMGESQELGGVTESMGESQELGGVTESMGESQELGGVTESMGESQELGGVTESMGESQELGGVTESMGESQELGGSTELFGEEAVEVGDYTAGASRADKDETVSLQMQIQEESMDDLTEELDGFEVAEGDAAEGEGELGLDSGGSEGDTQFETRSKTTHRGIWLFLGTAAAAAAVAAVLLWPQWKGYAVFAVEFAKSYIADDEVAYGAENAAETGGAAKESMSDSGGKGTATVDNQEPSGKDVLQKEPETVTVSGQIEKSGDAVRNNYCAVWNNVISLSLGNSIVDDKVRGE